MAAAAARGKKGNLAKTRERTDEQRNGNRASEQGNERVSGKLRHSDICVPRSRGYDDVDTGWTHDSLTVVLLKKGLNQIPFPLSFCFSGRYPFPEKNGHGSLS